MSARAAPSVYTIPAGAAFVDGLASGLLHEAGDDPLRLTDMLILMPNRRSCRALREGFLRVSGGRALLLPDMRPIGEVDEDELHFSDALPVVDTDLPPAIPALRRQVLLAELILRHAADPVSPDQATRLAADLARLLDQIQTERLDFAGLAAIVPDRYAEHWQKTLDFLRVLTEDWPRRLAAEGFIDPATRRNVLLEAQVKALQQEPPTQRIVAAGSTGSIPAAADLLLTIAGLPNGALVLPGLDRDIDDAVASVARDDQTHPQYGMLRLLGRLALTPSAVPDWPGCVDPGPALAARRRLISEAMRPAPTTEAWQSLSGIDARALSDIERVDCAGEGEEANVIALALRSAIERPGEVAALVTPDRALARRVAAALRRWHLEIDDSAGMPLDQTPPGLFLGLLAEMAEQRFTPVATLAALKHPLATCGRDRETFRRDVRRWERLVLRGPRPETGLDGLRRSVPSTLTAEDKSALGALMDGLVRALGPFGARMSGPRCDFLQLLDAHLAAAEALAADSGGAGAARLWAGEAGEALAAFIEEVRETADALGEIEPSAYPALLAALMAGRVVRPRYGRHPRLHIWGPLEARLQRADFVVLGGLNEGGWPRNPDPDPWLSRPMQSEFGLPLPERRIGLAAHDFAVAACSPRVLLTRSEKSQGTPTVPSRWLSRLDAVLQTIGDRQGFGQSVQWQYWHQHLDRPTESRRIVAPAPRPPFEARPRRLSVTRIETWMRDPYAIFARYILRLEALEPLEADPTAADRGTVIHQALDRFVRETADGLPDDAEARLLVLGRELFSSALAHPVVHAFWWPRFERIARWFVACERERRANVVASVTEGKGQLVVPARQGDFTLTAYADRIDRLRGGGCEVIDYKTGQPPSRRDLETGYAPQLPLEAAMVAAGAFPGIPAEPVRSISFWRLSGGEPAGEIQTMDGNIAEVSAATLEGLRSLIDAFDDEATPYAPVPDPTHAPRFSDYEHLARMAEWAGYRDDGR